MKLKDLLKEKDLYKKTDLWLISLMTLAAFLLSGLTIYDISSLPLFSGGTVADVEMSDLYNAVGNRRRVMKKASHTTILSIDGCSRAQIADALELLSFMGPSTIGMDVFFLRKDDEGELLEKALKEFPAVVLPLDLHRPEMISFFQDSIPRAQEGFVNIISSNATGSVRRFSCTSGDIPSFPYVLAGKPPLESVKSNLIRFDGTTIPVIQAKSLSIADADDISGKIVIIGAMDDPSDMYRTPIGYQTPGILIHAVVTELISSGRYLRKCNIWLERIIAIAICALFLWLTLILKRYKDDAGTLTMRIVLILLVFTLFIIGCRFYISWGWYFNLSLTVTMLAMGAFVFDIVSGIYALIPDRKI